MASNTTVCAAPQTMADATIFSPLIWGKNHKYRWNRNDLQTVVLHTDDYENNYMFYSIDWY